MAETTSQIVAKSQKVNRLSKQEGPLDEGEFVL